MPVRPIEDSPDEVEVIEEAGSDVRQNLTKIGFLLFIALLGIYFSALWRNLGESDARYVAFEDPIVTPIITPAEITGTPRPTRAYRLFAPKEELFLSPEQTVEELKNESTELVQEKIASASASAQEIVADVGVQVLGEATEIAKQTASDSAEVITNTIYKYTIGAVIRQLLDRLPDSAKQEVITDICVHDGCPDAPTATPSE